MYLCVYAHMHERETQREFCVSPCSTVQLGAVFLTHLVLLQNGVMHKHVYVCIHIDIDIYLCMYLYLYMKNMF